MLGDNLNTPAVVYTGKKKRKRSEREVWACMVQRCTDPTNDGYYLYGGRGIAICDYLRANSDNFLSVVGSRPSMQHSLDRIDNSGGYWCGHCTECTANSWPKNVRWATREVQHANRRVTCLVTLDGITKTLQRWAEDLGIGRGTLHYRLKVGWSAEKILSPPDRRRPKINAVSRAIHG